MYLGLWIMLASGFVLVAFFMLLQAESAQNRRLVLVRVRSHLDTRLITWREHGNRWMHHFGAGSLRILLHYLAHQILGVILRLVRFIEGILDRLRHRNKVVARAVKDRDRTHLDHIAEHKESTSLSDKEKQSLKEKSLEE